MAAGDPTLRETRANRPLDEAEIRDRVERLLSRMTVEEKVGQLTQYFDFLTAPDDAKRVEAEVAAGRAGSLLFVSDLADINRLQRIAVEKTRLGIPLLFAFDVIHGFKTAMPVPLALAATWDPEIVERAQAVAAEEARAVGLHWAFAPMVDIARDPRWGRMIEGAGEDPHLGSVMAAAQVRGFQGPFLGAEGRVVAGPKHFVGYGAALGGRDYDEVDLSENQLWNVYLPPFKAAIDAGAGNIMSAYMGLNGVPASGNRRLLTEILRGELGFRGFVVTDAGAAADLETHGYAPDQVEAGARALRAGVDMEMTPPFGKPAFFTLAKSLETGRIRIEEVDAAVRRILDVKARMGLFETPYVDPEEAERVLSDPAHRDVARTAAERSAVLLRNEGGVLPLDAGKLNSIAVIGPFADAAREMAGPWIFRQDDTETVTVLAGVKATIGPETRVEHSPGVEIPARMFPSIFESPEHPQAPRPSVDDEREIARAVELARSSDVTILTLGEAQIMIGENASRSSLDLPGRQQELLEAVVAVGKPVVVLLFGGRPLDLKGVNPDALMVVWYPGTRAGEAIANLLFGKVSPGGKLPFTWPRNIGQIPSPYARLTSHQPAKAEQRYWNEPNSPLYPFGFGLSYSTFRYSTPRLGAKRVLIGETTTVSFDLTNTGDRVADETAQVYIHQRYGTSARPVRELKAFKRVTLAPGETRTLEFSLGPSELRHWSDAEGGWIQDETIIDVYVGSDATALFGGSFEVTRG